MKIIEPSNKSVPFGTLSARIVFLYCHNIFVKSIESSSTNAYNLTSMHTADFSDEILVTPYPNAQLVLEP